MIKMTRRWYKKLKKTNILWIFCEGQTEKRYFENLRVTERPRITIKSKVSGTTAKQIVEEDSPRTKTMVDTVSNVTIF